MWLPCIFALFVNASPLSNCGPLDMMFLQDTTASFVDVLPNIRTQLPSLTATILDRYPGSHFGVADFRDKPYIPLGMPSDFCYRLDESLSSDLNGFYDAYGGLIASGGGDFPNDVLQAMVNVVLDPAVPWRPYQDATEAGNRFMVVITESLPHVSGDIAEYNPEQYPDLPQNLPPNTGGITNNDITYSCLHRDYLSPLQVPGVLLNAQIRAIIITPDHPNITGTWDTLNFYLAQPANFYQKLQDDFSGLTEAIINVLDSMSSGCPGSTVPPSSTLGEHSEETSEATSHETETASQSTTGTRVPVPSSTETTEAETSAVSSIIPATVLSSTEATERETFSLISSTVLSSTETTEGVSSIIASTIPSSTEATEGDTSAHSSTIASTVPSRPESTVLSTIPSLPTSDDLTSTESPEGASSTVSHSFTTTKGETTQELSTTAFPFQSASRLTPSELTTTTGTQSPSTLLSSAGAGTEALTSSEFITILPSSDMLSTVTSQPQGRCGRNQQWYLKDAPEITVTFGEAEGVVFFVLHFEDVAYVSVSLSSQMCMANFDPFVVDMSWGIVPPALQEWAATIKASETWTADSSGMTLYRPCLPDVELLPFWPDLADTMCLYSHTWASLNQVWPGAFPFVIEMAATRTHLNVVSRFSEYMIVTSYTTEAGRPCTNLVFAESNIMPINSNLSINTSDLHARAGANGEAEFMTSWIQLLERARHFLVQNRLLYIKTDQMEPAWFVGV